MLHLSSAATQNGFNFGSSILNHQPLRQGLYSRGQAVKVKVHYVACIIFLLLWFLLKLFDKISGQRDISWETGGHWSYVTCDYKKTCSQ